MWNEVTILWNELTILWNDLTTDWNDLTMERNDRIPFPCAGKIFFSKTFGYKPRPPLEPKF